MAKITKAMFKKALENSYGTNVDLSKRLHVTEGAMTQYIQRHPDMKELLDKKRLSNVGRAENEIFSQLEFEDSKSESSAAKIRQTASQFILTRLGKNKGWVEKTEQEIEHKGVEQLKVIIEEKIPDVEKVKEVSNNG